MSNIKIHVPELGDVSDVEVIEMLVAVGDTIAADDPIMVLESDKASMDIPCPQAGTIETIHIKVGDKVNSGDAMLTLSSAEDSPAASTSASAQNKNSPNDKAEKAPTKKAATDTSTETESAAPSAEPIEAQTQTKASNNDQKDASSGASQNIHASPAVRRIASEHQVDLSQLSGSGPHGRITKGDLQTHLGLAGTANTVQDAAAGINSNVGASAKQSNTTPPANPQALTRIQKLSAKHLHKSWTNIPHVTHFDDADITDLEQWRLSLIAQQTNPKTSLLPFVMKAVAHCLQEQPRFNCQLSADGESLTFHDHYHLGIAVDTPEGLVVPVIQNVDQMGIQQLSTLLRDTAQRARDNQLKARDLQGGCFTISNLGGIGGQHFTPIINAPEVAILGLGQARWELRRCGAPNSNAAIEDRLIQSLSLSYDHRVIDGVEAAKFISRLKRYLEDLRELLL